MRKCIFRSDGTVTLFCTLVMMVLVIFFMVLVDFCRLLLFQRMAESAVKLSAQSVISAYDQRLYEQYGLFARGGTEAHHLFVEAMKYNLMNSINVLSKDQGHDFAASRLEEAEVYGTEFLGQPIVFKHQILEDMKYKAPINYTMEFIEQWLPLQSAVEKGTALISVADKLMEMYQKRESHLIEALQEQKKLSQLLSSAYRNNLTSSTKNTLQKYSNYIDWLQEAEKISEVISQNIEEYSLEQMQELYNELERYDSQINSYIKTANNITRLLQKDVNQWLEQAEALFNNIDHNIQSAAALDNTMAIQYKLYLESMASTPTTGDTQLHTELDQIRFDDSMLRGEEELKQYRAAAKQQYSVLEAIFNSGLQLSNQLNILVQQPKLLRYQSDYQATKDKSDAASALVEQYFKAYQNPGDILTYWEAKINKMDKVNKQIADYESQFSEALQEWESIQNLLKAKEQGKENHTEFQQLSEHYSQLKSTNNTAANAPLIQAIAGNSSSMAKQSAQRLSSIYSFIAEIMSGVRDTVYVNEYGLHRFSAFPFGEDKENTEMFSIDSFNVENQQVEYILYGLHDPYANIAVVLTELFVLRFALRTIEGLIVNKGLSHPLIILSAAAVYGVKEAIYDMRELMAQGKTKLSKYVPIEVTYKQYLRILLLLHMEEESTKLTRMLALIQLDTGISLMQTPTAILAQAKVSLDLWSLPGVANLLSINNGFGGEVVGNAYKKYEMAAASY